VGYVWLAKLCFLGYICKNEFSGKPMVNMDLQSSLRRQRWHAKHIRAGLQCQYGLKRIADGKSHVIGHPLVKWTLWTLWTSTCSSKASGVGQIPFCTLFTLSFTPVGVLFDLPRRGNTMSNPWWSCAEHCETWGGAAPQTRAPGARVQRSRGPCQANLRAFSLRRGIKQ
jgi:hypothetical protein